MIINLKLNQNNNKTKHQVYRSLAPETSAGLAFLLSAALRRRSREQDRPTTRVVLVRVGVCNQTRVVYS